jgi:hypothetical protein
MIFSGRVQHVAVGFNDGDAFPKMQFMRVRVPLPFKVSDGVVGATHIAWSLARLPIKNELLWTDRHWFADELFDLLLRQGRNISCAYKFFDLPGAINVGVRICRVGHGGGQRTNKKKAAEKSGGFHREALLNLVGGTSRKGALS